MKKTVFYDDYFSGCVEAGLAKREPRTRDQVEGPVKAWTQWFRAHYCVLSY